MPILTIMTNANNEDVNIVLISDSFTFEDTFPDHTGNINIECEPGTYELFLWVSDVLDYQVLEVGEPSEIIYN